MTRLKEVRETSITKRDRFIDIETKGCVIHIYPALVNFEGKPVTAIEVRPDAEYEFDIGQSRTRVKERG